MGRGPHEGGRSGAVPETLKGSVVALSPAAGGTQGPPLPLRNVPCFDSNSFSTLHRDLSPGNGLPGVQRNKSCWGGVGGEDCHALQQQVGLDHLFPGFKQWEGSPTFGSLPYIR